MNDRSAFDHRPDPELGRALQALLATDDDRAFVQRVLAAAPWGRDHASWFDVLTAWARPGLVAASLLVAAALAWFAIAPDGVGVTVSLGDPLPAAGELAAVPSYVVADAPDVNAVMAIVPENE